MKYIIFPVLLFFLSVFASAQQRQYSTTDRQAIKYFALANQSLDENMYDDAIVQLQKALDADDKFIEAHSALGNIYRMIHQHETAIEQYLKVIKLNPDYSSAVYLRLGNEEIDIARYESARLHLEKYLTYPDITSANISYAQKLISDCKFSVYAVQHPVPFKPVNIGPEINTPDDEYNPVATADENTLIFTRQINNNEDFYKSVKVDGKWQTATYLSDQINTPEYNEGAQSISQDTKQFFFTGCNRPDGLGRCDIYIAQKKGDDWGKPFDLSPPVNTPGWESQPSISAD